jgi:hypothetical protein
MTIPKKNKGITAAVFLVIAGAIGLFVGIWVISLVLNSISLPTFATRVVNETINFAANNTLYNFANQANCLSATPTPSNCGILTTGVTNVGNLTMNLNTTCYSWTTSQIKILNLGDVTCGVKLGNYLVSYTFYDFVTNQAQNTMNTVTSTVFNAFSLLAVGLIVLAAAVIIGYFSFGRNKSGM